MFGNRMVKMGHGLADWATGEWHFSYYKSVKQLCDLSKEEYLRFCFGIEIVHASIIVWVVNVTFNETSLDLKTILDSMVARFVENQAKITINLEIDKMVIYEPEMAYLRKRFNVLPKTTTNFYTLTDMLFEFRKAEYLESLGIGFADKGRLHNPVGLGPTGPITRTFGRHVMGATKETAFIVALPALLLDRINSIFQYCSKKA
jgi:hypothetical protein